MKIFNIALMSLILAAAPVAANAEDVSPKVAVVDVERLLSESNSGKDIKKQVESRRETFQKELAVQEESLRKQQETLVKMKEDKKATQDDFNKKVQDFEKKVAEAQKLLQDRRAELEKSALESMNSLRGKALEAVGEVATKGKYDIVLTKQNVILAAEEMDITDEALKALNAKTKK